MTFFKRDSYVWLFMSVIEFSHLLIFAYIDSTVSADDVRIVYHIVIGLLKLHPIFKTLNIVRCLKNLIINL